MSGAGDVNGDGHPDVVAGSWKFSASFNGEGSVAVFPGTGQSISHTPLGRYEPGQAFAGLGVAVTSAGDVNGDGFDDVIAIADLWDNGQPDEGGAFLFYGSATGPYLNVPDWTFESDQAGARLLSVACAGDINGDGFDDLLLGAPWYDSAVVDGGRVYCFYGSAAGLSTIASWTLDGALADQLLGFSVAGPGDVNGDGYDDVLIAGPGADIAPGLIGKVLLAYGSPSGLMTPTWSYQSSQPGSLLGICARGQGDADGDGYADLLFAAHNFSGGEQHEGRAYYFRGGPQGPADEPTWTVESDQVGAAFGRALAFAGDLNGDGYDDAAVGAFRFDNGQTDEGRVFVYLGSPCGLEEKPSWIRELDQGDAWFGIDVAGPGDMNSDGFDDLLVGGSKYDSSFSDEGSVSLFAGYALVDCNGNGVDDALDLSGGGSLDCNANNIPDECDIDCGPSSDYNQNGAPDECDPVGTPFCFGDGTGLPCPCLNENDLSVANGNSGCANQASPGGAVLQVSGSARLAAADLTLKATQLPPFKPGIFFQGNSMLNGGLGVPFGDGLRCVGSGIVRIKVVAADATGTADSLGTAVGQVGGAAPGDVRSYQYWYRDSGWGFCSGGYNLTNGMNILWLL